MLGAIATFTEALLKDYRQAVTVSINIRISTERKTTMNAAIAQHLNVVESAIVRVEEWAKVLFVVVKGVGGRFVSKKVAKVEAEKSLEDRMIEAGGSRWQKGDKDRIYFNDIRQRYGLETQHYGTGNISNATFAGNRISNSEAKRIWAACDGKLWWDVTAQKWQYQGITKEVADDVILGIEVDCGL